MENKFSVNAHYTGLRRKLSYYFRLFFLDGHEVAFTKFAIAKWAKKNHTRNKGQLLIETVKYHPYIFQIAYQSNFLADKYKLEIKTINSSYYGRNKWLNKYLHRYLSSTKVFKSFNASAGVNYYSLPTKMERVCKRLALKAFGGLDSKEALINLKVDDVRIGDLIYDTYLRNNQLATVDIHNAKLLKVIENAYVILASCKKYLDENNVGMIVTLHATYIQHAILVRLAVLRKIPVYMYAHREGRLNQKLTLVHTCQLPNHAQYKQIFSKLENKGDALARAKRLLKTRMSGEIDAGIAYMKQSAYSDTDDSHEKVFAATGRPVVVVFLHCFFDSPHIYKGMLFADFYEWLDFTLEVASSSNFDCYVKPHPNGLEGNDKLVEFFARKYPNINFIDKNLSNKVIMAEEVGLGVTSHGTVAHELAYHGIPTLVAGDNPHANYDFCYTAKNIKEYERLLSSPTNVPCEIKREEVEQFFYMHYLYQSDVYRGVGARWSDVFQMLRLSNHRSEILTNLVEYSQSGDFDGIEDYFNAVIRHLDKE